MFTRLFGLALLVGCTSTTTKDDDETGAVDSDSTTTGVIVDHEGYEFPILDGIAYELEIDGTNYLGIRLSNVPDACTSLTWLMRRDNDLSRMFRREPFDEDAFVEAIDNSRDSWDERIGVDLLMQLIVEIEVPPRDTPQSYELNTDAWAVARAGGPFEYTSNEDGTSRSFGMSGGYEAVTSTGDLDFTLTSTGVTGTVSGTIQTDELAEFDIDLSFDVEMCPDWATAWAEGL